MSFHKLVKQYGKIHNLGKQIVKHKYYINQTPQSNIDQEFYEVEEGHKADLLTNLLSKYKLESSIVFCNTKHKCQQIAADLNKKGFYAQAIHGDLEQRDRDQVLVLFASKSTSILVATDVAARGLDIKDLTAVINFDLSKNPEVHVHRIGRTGRAGNKGMAFSFVSKQDHYKLKEITEYQDKKFNLIKQTISKINRLKTFNNSRV